MYEYMMLLDTLFCQGKGWNYISFKVKYFESIKKQKTKAWLIYEPLPLGELKEI